MKKTNGDPASRARVRLRQAIDRACLARGRAQWTSGYISGVRAGGDEDLEDLMAQAREQFADCDRAELTAERAMRSYAAAICRAKARKA